MSTAPNSGMASHDTPRFRLFPLSLPVAWGILIGGGALSLSLFPFPIRTGSINHTTQSAVVSLAQGIEGYFDEYDRLPLAIHPQPVPTDGSGLMDALLALDPTANPKGIRFYSGRKAKHGRNGIIGPSPAHNHAELRDRWGQPLFIVMDTDGDKKITDPFDPSTIVHNRRSLVWSTGRDGKHDLTNPDAKVNRDNIYSWKP